MKLGLSVFGIMALSIASVPVPTFAQTSPNPATGGTVASAPNKDAPTAPGAPSASNAESEASGIASRIEHARKEGKDVSKAEAEEKQGEAALQAGYKAEAAQHFERAKKDLGAM
ncbi:MAG TPA: hypothetical protein VKV03_07415 [Candidatus Binataceae bacterium]|nr:hypothetical protein [Candidatus Binataceae bacterium]